MANGGERREDGVAKGSGPVHERSRAPAGPAQRREPLMRMNRRDARHLVSHSPFDPLAESHHGDRTGFARSGQAHLHDSAHLVEVKELHVSSVGLNGRANGVEHRLDPFLG